MVGSVLGNRVLRKEDPKFLTTGGTYVGDLKDELLNGALHVTYVRSSVAHGRITAIDTSQAAGLPGVRAILTASDLALAHQPSRFNPSVTRSLLASDRVRYVGEPVALVVTDRANQGEDAAEAVVVDYDVLPAVVDVEQAMAPDAPQLYPDLNSNVVFDTVTMGIPDITGDAFFDDCEVVVRERFVNQRLAPCPLEVRAAAAVWVGGRLYQWASTQHAQGARDSIAEVNGVPVEDVRVITPDVGGGFGAKVGAYPEELLLGVVSARLGCPVRWQETRSESMLGLGHGRAQVQLVTIGGSRNGRIDALQMHLLQDSGSFVEFGAVIAPFMTRPMASGVYAIPRIEVRTTSVVTNTTPVVAYRGAGRPEATAAVERAMDLFAAEIRMDAAEIRRINMIPRFLEPHTTAIGQTYDVGDFGEALDRVLSAANYSTLRAEQAERRARGDVVQIGIGVSSYVEITGGAPPLSEAAKIDVRDDGRAVVFTGTSPNGQGHVTSWSMLVSQRTGIPLDQIDVVFGDTDQVPEGGGTMGSRSLQIGGAAVDQASVGLVEAAIKLAAQSLEADPADVVLDTDSGRFHVTGTPAVSRSWSELAEIAKADGGLAYRTRFESGGPTFPFGAHLAVVEVDTETGHVRLVRHVACDDAGTVLNPLIFDGQIHGGIAQGVAQALFEEVCYDSDGNPITTNLADYAFISAAELPSFEVVPMETPTPRNPLGAKGVGESGTIGSTPAVQSAVIDALSHLGVRHIDMPATAERVWRAINEAHPK